MLLLPAQKEAEALALTNVLIHEVKDRERRRTKSGNLPEILPKFWDRKEKILKEQEVKNIRGKLDPNRLWIDTTIKNVTSFSVLLSFLRVSHGVA